MTSSPRKRRELAPTSRRIELVGQLSRLPGRRSPCTHLRLESARALRLGLRGRPHVDRNVIGGGRRARMDSAVRVPHRDLCARRSRAHARHGDGPAGEHPRERQRDPRRIWLVESDVGDHAGGRDVGASIVRCRDVPSARGCDGADRGDGGEPFGRPLPSTAAGSGRSAVGRTSTASEADRASRVDALGALLGQRVRCDRQRATSLMVVRSRDRPRMATGGVSDRGRGRICRSATGIWGCPSERGRFVRCLDRGPSRRVRVVRGRVRGRSARRRRARAPGSVRLRRLRIVRSERSPRVARCRRPTFLVAAPAIFAACDRPGDRAPCAPFLRDSRPFALARRGSPSAAPGHGAPDRRGGVEFFLTDCRAAGHC